MIKKTLMAVLIAVQMNTAVYADVTQQDYKKLGKMTIIRGDTYSEALTIKEEIMSLLAKKQFKALDQRIVKELKSEAIFLNGKNRHTIYLEKLAEITERYRTRDESVWDQQQQLADEWLKATPKSPLPYLFEAYLLGAKSWVYRGGNYIHEVSQDDLDIFIKLQMQRISFLLEHKEIASKDPFYYVALLKSYQNFGAVNEAYATYKEGIAKFPAYRPIYNTYIAINDPKWLGGYPGMIEEVIADIQRLNPGPNQDMYYYLIVFTATDRGNPFHLEGNSIDWERVERGSILALERYPSFSRITQVAELMCSFKGNRARVNRLYSAFGDEQIPESLKNTILNSCPE
ncbi:hypothetical protein [Acinetobacter nematophilus]|uniref:Tetratricopeptide repeat protein n=1 Tax=Acinetobacter nematophilus TaxID=2994642 RepID=A0A9X3DSH4_9GAMM|nr:hypothetical protein [Acinetobacter nematophilus]MCX5467022.1 hypothetical protein [Acinetobacter nematophilus]